MGDSYSKPENGGGENGGLIFKARKWGRGKWGTHFQSTKMGVKYSCGLLMIGLCYNPFMVQEEELKAYKKRWEEVETVQREEEITSSYELRWKQLNSIYRMAQGLGIIQPDLSESEVYERWATLKEKLTFPKA